MPSVNGRPSSDAAKRPGGGEAGVVTGVAIIGCGYVADFYVATLPNHPELVIRGVYDRDPVRLAAFSRHHGLRAYPDAASLLADPAVELVLNLTNPHSHFAVSRQALEAGKHVYSEKPLALELDEARELVELAARRRLSLRAAPATHLGEAARATADVLSRGDLGSVGWSTPNSMTAWCSGRAAKDGEAPRARPGRQPTSSASAAPSSTQVIM